MRSAPAGEHDGPAAWSLDLRTGELRSSAARAQMLGYDALSVPQSPEWWDSLLHTDERIAVHTARARHIDGEGCGYKSEYRARRQDGSWAWLLEVGCIERDRSGRARRVAGVLLDISIDREGRFRLQQRLERLRTVFDYTYQLAALLSRDGVLLETNRTSLKSAGIALDAAVGRPLWQTPFWTQQPEAQIARLRDGIERAGRGEFVRFQYQPHGPGRDARMVDFSLLPVFDDDGAVLWILAEGRDVTEVVYAHRALRTLEDRLAVAASSANLGLWDFNPHTGESWVNDRWWTMLGYEPHEMQPSLECWQALVHPDDLVPALAVINPSQPAPGGFRTELRMRCKDGSWRWIHCSGRPVESDGGGQPRRIAGVQLDVTERKEAERRLATAERLESVGKLAAGVAHEINTPIQFVSDSLHFIRDAAHELLQLTGGLRSMAAADAANSNRVAALSADLPYLAEHLPKAIERSLDGLQRVAEIVGSMRELAYPDRPEMADVDLNHLIRIALVVARSEYKPVAEVELDLSPLPAVRCHGGELNQVLLNLLVNAAHAVAAAVDGSAHKGLITVASRLDGDSVLISVADSGTGIAEDIRHRIFEPFFTTKEVGRGTGQGLALSHNIIVKRHRGTIDFHSEVGKGTVFFVRLPLDCQGERAPQQPLQQAPEQAA